MQYDPYYSKEAIYIAGPECFYVHGYPHWNALRARAEMFGFQVSLPNDNVVKTDHEDLRENARAIYRNCEESIAKTTAIIVDLEYYRGPDVDGGSIFEVGMAYAVGARCYGYTRDLRDTRFKYQGYSLGADCAYDRKGRKLPFANLPFSPNVVSACKIVEGGFDGALQTLMVDLTEERKTGVRTQNPLPDVPSVEKDGRPVILLAGPQRWDNDAAEKYAAMKSICEARGLVALTPMDPLPGEAADSGDAYVDAYRQFRRNQQHVRDCDLILADLNDFHGWEPDADTSFECGMAVQLGKKAYGYMSDTTRMIDRVPNFGPDHEFRDHCGCNAENFNYPINLMFSAPMPILQGQFEQVLDMALADYLGK